MLLVNNSDLKSSASDQLNWINSGLLIIQIIEYLLAIVTLKMKIASFRVRLSWEVCQFYLGFAT